MKKLKFKKKEVAINNRSKSNKKNLIVLLISLAGIFYSCNKNKELRTKTPKKLTNNNQNIQSSQNHLNNNSSINDKKEKQLFTDIYELFSDSDYEFEGNNDQDDEKEIDISFNYNKKESCKPVAISYKNYLNNNNLAYFPGINKIGSFKFELNNNKSVINNTINPIILGANHSFKCDEQYTLDFFKNLKQKNKKKIQLFYEANDESYKVISLALKKIYNDDFIEIQKDGRIEFLKELANDDFIAEKYEQKLNYIYYYDICSRNENLDSNTIYFWEILFNNKVVKKIRDLNEKILKYDLYKESYKSWSESLILELEKLQLKAKTNPQYILNKKDREIIEQVWNIIFCNSFLLEILEKADPNCLQIIVLGTKHLIEIDEFLKPSCEIYKPSNSISWSEPANIRIISDSCKHHKNDTLCTKQFKSFRIIENRHKKCLALIDYKNAKNQYLNSNFKDFFHCMKQTKYTLQKGIEDLNLYDFKNQDYKNFYFLNNPKNIIKRYININNNFESKQKLNPFFENIIYYIKNNIDEKDLYFGNYYNNIIKNREEKIKKALNKEQIIKYKEKGIFKHILQFKRNLLEEINKITTKKEYQNQNSNDIKFLKELFIGINKTVKNLNRVCHG